MWRSACIKTCSSRSCLVNLSPELANFFTKRSQSSHMTVVLELEHVERSIYVSWSGDLAVDRFSKGFESVSSVVEIGKRFADCLGLTERQQVIVRSVDSIPSCTRAYIDPATPDDWEILQIHASYIESHLLDQVRVVFPGEELPIWINRNTHVLIRIGSIEPASFCAKLEEFTEVAIAPNIRTEHKKARTPAHDHGPVKFPASDENQSNLKQENKSDAIAQALHQDGRLTDNTNLSSKLYNFMSSLFAGDTMETAEIQTTMSSGGEYQTAGEGGAVQTLKCCQTSFECTKLDLCLRVQPFEKGTSVACLSQPSTVFVCLTSLPDSSQLHCSHCRRLLPVSRRGLFQIAELGKVACPKEMAKIVSTNNKKGSGADTDVSGQNTQQNSSMITNTMIREGQNTVQGTETQPLNIPGLGLGDATVKLAVIAPPFMGTNSSNLEPTRRVLPGHILVPSGLCKQLGIAPLSLVRVVSNSQGPAELKGLILRPHDDSIGKCPYTGDEEILSAFKKWLSGVCSNHSPLVVTNEMTISFAVLPNEGLLDCTLSVLSHSDTKGSMPYYFLTPETAEKMTVVVGQPMVSTSPEHLELHRENICEVPFKLMRNTIHDLGGMFDLYSKCLEHLLISLGHRPVADQLGEEMLVGLRGGALLISGGAGCGKTSLAHAICYKLHQWPICAHISVVQCIPLRGKKVETIQKQLQQVFREAAWHQPAVILLDDLDQVISAPSPTQEIGGEALYRRRLVEVFKDLVRVEVANRSKVVVIATSRSRDSIHPSLVSCRGLHIFQCWVEIAPLDSEQRKDILSSILKRKIPGDLNLDFSSLAKKTEGFSAKDLSSLTDRAIHFTVVRQMTPRAGGSKDTTEGDYQAALEDFQPAALRGVALHSAGELGWSDVGGLANVKDALTETLLWPTKYTALFSKCPLRLRSGLLLYGPPGTGKTLLAGVVAKECGLNFISIKGPELLSKYIGASEQAVREIFTRAQSAKPCILFFDEFDSLAPRRGHDSTGVTDRVVNQLLTQLDGVEGLQGVYILGATSRPDLIDTALLRPGRLDKCLYCGIPDKDERVEILRALSRKLPLAEDTDLEATAGMCEQFTGADIKALLYNAQLEAIHRTIGKSHLYGGILGSSKPNTSGAGDIGEGESLAGTTVKAGRSLGFGDADIRPQIYWPSVGKGKRNISEDSESRILEQVSVIEENYVRNHENGASSKASVKQPKLQPENTKGNSKVLSSKSSRSTLNELPTETAKPVVTIHQSDLMKAALAMSPSVSESERRRYNAIYQSFVASRGGTFATQIPSHGKATLA